MTRGQRLGRVGRGARQARAHVGLGERGPKGQQPGDDRAVEAQIPLRQLSQAGGGHLCDGFVVAGLALQPAGDRLVEAQLARDPLHGLSLVDGFSLDEGGDGLQLGQVNLGHGERGEHAHGLLERGAHRLDRRDERDAEQTGLLWRPRPGVDVFGQGAFAAHLERQPRRIALTGQHRQHVEACGVSVVDPGNLKGQVQMGFFDLFGAERDAHAVEAGFGRAHQHRGWRRAAGPVTTEQLVDLCAQGGLVEVAHAGQHDVRGPVVLPVEGQHALAGVRAHVSLEADDWPAIRVQAKGLTEERLGGAPGGHVEAAFDFFADDFDLASQLAFVEG